MTTRNYSIVGNCRIGFGRLVSALLTVLSLGKHSLSALIGRLLSCMFMSLTTRSARRKLSIFFSFLIVTSMLLEPFSYGVRTASASAPGAADTPGEAAESTDSNVPPLPPPPQVPLPMIPLGDAHLPFLAMDIVVSPKYVAQGDIFTATLTIRNEAPNPADNLVLTLSQPTGIERIEHPQKGEQAQELAPGQAGWTWQLSRLDPNSSTTLSAVMRLTGPQPGDAIVLEATATADRLTAPAARMGGALVVQKGLGPTTARFNPGSAVSLRSADGRVEVKVPANASKTGLTLEHDWQAVSEQGGSGTQVGRKQLFPAFELTARDDQGNDVHKFSAPLTISLSYTPQQLQAIGIAEEDLRVFWFDESAPQGGRWTSIPSSVDSSSHTVTASVDHFSLYALSDDSSPSTAFIPSLQGWQVGLYSGNVTYQYDIEVPAGPAGVKPSIGLSYNSTATDRRIDTRWRAQSQSSWVGKGWSLDTGYVALNRLPGNPETGRYYSLVFGGKSYDLVRGEPRVLTPTLSIPTHWEWHPTDESFIRARVETTGTLSLRGSGNSSAQRYLWKVWTPDGTLFVFEEDAWQGFHGCGTANESFIETYKWHLTLIEDTHGNQIEYKYARNAREQYTSCNAVVLYPDYEIVPTEILWGKNKNVATTDAGHKHRFRVVFGANSRGTVDDDWDHADNQIGPAPHETMRLDTITVQIMQADNVWQRVREYRLAYETNTSLMLLSDSATKDPNGVWLGDSALTKLTLKSIQRLDMNANSPVPPVLIPAMTFGYMTGTNAGNGTYVAGAWNRLTSVDNGQGGKITFTYENIGTNLANPSSPDYAPGAANKFAHNRRVKTKVIEDGRGNSYTWSYDYRYPAYNSLGTLDSSGTENGPNQWPNSASLVYAQYHHQDEASRVRYLVHQPYTEFRGHGVVTETLPTSTLVNNAPQLNQVTHWFIQGDVPGHGNKIGATCPITNYVGSDDMLANSCFVALRNREFLKGREEKTVVHAGSTAQPVLFETQRTFAVDFISDASDHGDDRVHGLWRAFTFESETKEIERESSANTSVSKRTVYQYDTSTGGSTGNLLSVSEYDASNALYRKTEHSYKTLINANSYILDRKRKDAITDGSGTLLAQTIYGWDGSLGGPEPLTIGELNLVRKYYTLPQPFPNNSTANSTDTKYGYDTFGNTITSTTYLNGGATTYTYSNPSDPNSLSVTYGAPGNCATPCSMERTTTTKYDEVYNAFSIKITPPIAALATQADYDYRLGLMTTITDANGQVTRATYDTYGRMTSVMEPGDTTYPTVSIEYVNRSGTTSPFAYRVFRREVAGNAAARTITKFYDGLGREIQTKSESKDNEQNIVIDKQYDGMGQVNREWVPRYVNNTLGDSAAFYGFVAINSSVVSTTMRYDAMGRTIKVTPPDGNSSTVEYSFGTNTRTNATMQQVVTIDARGNKKAHLSDVFGRLAQVKEFNTDATPYSYTNYSYSALDLLTTVTDGNNKVTSVTYDSLGRKTSIQDPTMGTWTYLYHPNGQLKKQTDAKAQWIEFDYDAMDRLIRKRYSDTTKVEYTYDQARTGYFNAGQRTTMARYTTTAAGGGEVNSSKLNFDERGRQKFVEHKIPARSATARTFTWNYDSADRVTSMVYPSAETVAYTYDAAWRQKSVCGQGQGQQCYATNASYTALDQPQTLTYGNNLVQNNSYETLSQRLQAIQVGTNGSVFSRSYTYDAVGNVGQIVGSGSTQTFTYDHLDRLKDWSSTGTLSATEHYEYDLIGNLTKKGTTGSEVVYGYNSTATNNGGPYALRTLNSGTAFQYDANGNLTSSPSTPFGDPARTLTWNVENMPSSIAVGSLNESYTYDADGERSSRVVTQNGQTTRTYYFGGLYEEDVLNGINTTVQRALYTLNGEVVAQRQLGLDPVTPKSALLVVGNMWPISAADTAIKNRLLNQGYVVSIRDDDQLDKRHAQGKTIVVVSSSVTAATVDTRLTYMEVPVLAWDAELFEKLGMSPTGTTNSGFATSQTQVSISNASHPMAAGLSGTVTVSTSAGNMAWGKVNANAAKVATLTSDSTKAVIFGYEKGAAMHGLVARARRVGFFMSDNTASTLTDNGWALFDAAVNWAIGTPATTSSACRVTWANATNVTVSGNTIKKTGGSDIQWDAIATSNGSFASGNVYAQAAADRSDDTYVKFGLDTGTSPGETTIDFAVYLSGGQLKVSENSNVTASLGTYIAGDVFKVSVESGVVKYYKNDTLFYTGAVAPSYPLYFNAVMADPDTRVLDARFCTAAGAAPTASISTAPRTAMFVTGSNTLNTAEVAIKNRLQTLGFIVNVRHYDYFTKADLEGKSLVLVSSSVLPDAIDERLIFTEVPVLVWEADLLDNMAMTSSTAGEFGFAAGQTQVSITNASHAMAAGLSGTVTVSSSAGNMAWGKPNANAAKVATLTGDSTKAVIFGYEKGAAMFNVLARARRVGFYFSDTTASTLTTDGWTLFDAAVRWAVGAIAGPGPTTIAIDSVTWAKAVNVTVSNNTLNKTAGVDYEWDGVAASNVSFSSGNVYAQAVADRSDDTYVKFGLDTGTSPGESTIDFALYLAGGTLKVSENSNVTASLGTYQPGDVFKVAVESGVVKYYKNGTLFYTSTVAPSYPLYFNAITPEPDGRVVDARFGQGTGSPPSGSSTSSGVVYLHRDHLGSVSVATGATGVVVSSQEFDPWGKVRTGGVTQTKLNYTGQHRDDTGLLYYHARYYDPSLARFVSPDSIVPGASSGAGGAGGTVGAWQNSKLTVDFHERGFMDSVAGENALTLQKGFWFQLSMQDRARAGNTFGPMNPQALNRYTYGLNNPMRYTDPTGHYTYQYDFVVGYTKDGITAQSAMAYVQRNPDHVFPFRIRPLNGCPAAITAGCTYELSGVGPGVPSYPVLVTEVTPTSFTFVTLTSDFHPKGSTITFSTYEKDGAVYLQQRANVPEPFQWWNPYDYARDFTLKTLSWFTWQNMALRLKSLLRWGDLRDYTGVGGTPCRQPPTGCKSAVVP